MSYVLSKTPAWLESPVFSFSDPGSEIVLLSGDGHQEKFPAVLLLSTSHLVRSLLADHLPPAYSPPAISLPAVTGQVLQVVRQLCTEGRAYVGEERKGEVENVFKMLNVSCQLDGDICEDHGKEMKVGVKSLFGEGAVLQPAYHDLSLQFKGGDEEQVQINLTQDQEITVNVEEEALVAQNIVILEASSSNEVSMHDLPEEEVSPDTFGKESDVNTIEEQIFFSQLGLRPCTSAMPIISPHTVTTTEMSVQVTTEEGQAPVQMETITKLSRKRKGLVSCLRSEGGAVDQGWMTKVKVEVIDDIEKAEAAHFKKLEAFGEMKAGKTSTRIITRSLKVDSGKLKSRPRGAGVGAGRQFQGPDGGQEKEHKHGQPSKRGKLSRLTKSVPRNFLCHECGKGFKTKNKLGRHSSSHTKVRSYHCDKCGNQYTTAAGLDAHIKVKHQGVKYQCEECDRQFGMKCNLTAHINQVHRRVKLFLCQTCDLSFAQKIHLTVHIAVVHENRKDFVCEHCNKCFGSTNNRKLHIERNHVDTNYPCSWPDCKYIGGSKVDLKAHMFVHNKEGYR